MSHSCPSAAPITRSSLILVQDSVDDGLENADRQTSSSPTCQYMNCLLYLLILAGLIPPRDRRCQPQQQRIIMIMESWKRALAPIVGTQFFASILQFFTFYVDSKVDIKKKGMLGGKGVPCPPPSPGPPPGGGVLNLESSCILALSQTCTLRIQSAMPPDAHVHTVNCQRSQRACGKA